MIVTMEEMKQYLRVDADDDDTIITDIEGAAERMVLDILRTDSLEYFAENPFVKTAVMYATAYLYEHREEADHRELLKTLRNLLSSIRGVGF